MATYAVLGSTGQVGGSILEVMLHSPERKIHALARSRRKLLAQKPELDSSPNVSIYEGALSDTDILRECITGTSVVFLCAAASDNIPYTDIAQQQAICVVRSLEAIRENDPRARLPQLIVLSSATLNEKFTQSTPAIGAWVIKRAASWVYADLRLAEEYLRSHDWIKQVHVKPGGLSHDKPHGHVLSTERSQSFLSFLDLAGGMVRNRWVEALPMSQTNADTSTHIS